jgi:hypothetical protein
MPFMADLHAIDISPPSMASNWAVLLSEHPLNIRVSQVDPGAEMLDAQT